MIVEGEVSEALAAAIPRAKLHEIHEMRKQFLINCAKFNRKQLQDQMRFAREAATTDQWADRVLVGMVDLIGQFRFGPTWETDGR